MYLMWIFFGSKLIRSNYQSSATLWVLETCLIVGHFFPLWSSWLTASLCSNKHNKASWCENWTFEGTLSTLFKMSNISWDRLFDPWLLSQFTTGCPVLSWVWIVFPRTKTIRSHKSRAGIPSYLNPASKRDDFGFCWTVWNWSLFLTHPTYRNKCMTSKNTLCSTRCRFWVLKISFKIGV